MKKSIILIVLLLLSVACGKSETEISGEIFVVTEGAGNYKLGLVQVVAIPEKDILEHIQSKQNAAAQNIAAAQSSYNKAKAALDEENRFFDRLKNSSYSDIDSLKESNERAAELEKLVETAKRSLNYETSGRSYFEDLPKSEITAQTNADGKFTLKIPSKEKYALVARSQRKVADGTEEYYWMNWIQADGKPQTVMLSNNNFTSENPPNGVIKTETKQEF